MNKLSFRARALDASKPMPIYMSEELPDLPEYSAINRAVPQMPSGMEKEEECEHHLQRAICTGIIIPTPEVIDIVESTTFESLYPADYKMPKQLIHMQPFLIDQEVPEYDMDSEDEAWIKEQQSKKMDISPDKFEEMMDRLEKGCGQTVLELNEAKTLLKEDDDLIVAVYDYWLTKRLNTAHPLIPQVKTETRLPGAATNNPYLAFRRRTEKMQTRKNRKNDEASYEKMLKLRRDLYRAISLLELIKRREKYKRENLHLAIEIYEKRYQAQDFSGTIVNELSAVKPPRPAYTPIYNHLNHNWVHKMPPPKVSPVAAKEDIARREKRQYKKRKHRSGQSSSNSNRGGALLESSTLPVSSEDEGVEPLGGLASDTEDDADSDGPYAFKRKKNCDSFLAPKPLAHGNWPWASKEDGGDGDVKYRYTLGSIRRPSPRCVGFVRRRLGRGGRVILDRATSSLDDYWSTLDFTILDSSAPKTPVAVETAPAAVAVTPASPGPSALPPTSTPASVSTSPSKPSTSTAPPLPSPPANKSDPELLADLTADWLHFCPVYEGGDEFSDCQLPFEELDVEDTDFEMAPSQEPSADLDFSELSSSKFSVIDASSYVPPKPVSPIPSTSSVVLPPPPVPPPLKTQRLALKDRIYQLQNNRGTTPNGPHSVKAATGIPQPNNSGSPAAVTALSPLTPSWTSDAPTSSRLTKPVQPSSTAEPALPGEGGAEMKKESHIPDEQSVEAILRHVMEVT
ncbi:enhancer of polycomb homolog 1 [Neocloeon triangulifer]|uniref:enhancer of polycomb homolog 1 n=1 Tax=Neocloeon triangulifer TaxID=2078957 RepID=UPI00286F444D|nr:enhancer of polycomb homolog 1 [Neocloeon triangulifer]